jgi:branched-subunit amino acid transport protein
MKVDLVPLAILMGLATYPWRALPLLAPGIDRLAPPIREYLRLVGPAMLGALAAVSVTVVLDVDRRPSLHVGVEWLAVVACIVVVASRRGLLTGLLVAAGLVAVLRAMGLAPLP